MNARIVPAVGRPVRLLPLEFVILLPRRHFAYNPSLPVAERGPPWPEYLHRRELVRAHIDGVFIDRHWEPDPTPLQFPVTLAVVPTEADLQVTVALHLSPFREVGRQVVDPIAGDARRAAKKMWARAAPRRGNVEYYWFPLMLYELARSFDFAAHSPRAFWRRAIHRRQTPDSVYAPVGPWQVTPRVPNDYILSATMTYDVSGARQPPIQVLEAVLADYWIAKPTRMTVEYR